jgi:hypothetical protein
MGDGMTRSVLECAGLLALLGRKIKIMNEEPKSIWKKSWTGRRALPVLVALLIFAGFLGALALNILHLENDKIFGIFFLVEWIVFTIGAAVAFLILLALFRFIRWLCCWRNFKRFLFGLACFITLIALFYAEEDWRGKHDWEKFKRQWEAKGERFDWQSIIPPSVPDDQNFAMAPIWVESMKAVLGPKNSRQWFGDNYAENGRTNFTDRLALNVWRSNDWGDLSPNGYWAKATITDLAAWQVYYRASVQTNRNSAITTNEFPVAAQPQTPAQDVLLALSKYDSTIEELQQASQLPYSRFPLNYDGMPAAILLPQLAAEKRCSQVLQLRAIAELQNGESQKALDDVKLMMRLTDASRTEPFLICHLVRIAIFNLTLQPVYEGLAEHKWSDAQLADLDSELAKLDFLTDYESAMRGERALEIANIEFLRHPHNYPQELGLRRPRYYFLAPMFSLAQMLSNMSSDNGDNENSQMDFQMLALSFGPSGWVDQNELRMAQFETKWYLPIVDKKTQTVSPTKVRASSDALDREMRHRSPENVLETLFMPALGGIVEKFAYAQSSVNLARVAIALERFRLAHGEFPESLDAVAAQFPDGIPHDIIGGEPLNYRRTSDGQFILYSVGWNERDDGGVVGLTKSGSVDNQKGDWVWRYPQNF